VVGSIDRVLCSLVLVLVLVLVVGCSGSALTARALPVPEWRVATDPPRGFDRSQRLL